MYIAVMNVCLFCLLHGQIFQIENLHSAVILLRCQSKMTTTDQWRIHENYDRQPWVNGV